MGRISVHQLKQWKAEGKRFAMITAYDYPSARLVEQAGIPIILVGDSVGSVVLGYESTVPVTMEDILYHTRAVVRGTSKAIVLADMPFMSYQANADDAVRNAGTVRYEMTLDDGSVAVAHVPARKDGLPRPGDRVEASWSDDAAVLLPGSPDAAPVPDPDAVSTDAADD